MQLLCFYLISALLLNAQGNSNIQNSIDKENIGNKNELTIWDIFQNRRSVRKYKQDAVPQEDIIKILDAARMAPTSGNQQPWKFLVVQDKNKINELKEACVKNRLARYKKSDKETDDTKEKEIRDRLGNYFSAPVYIIVLTDNNSIYSSYNHWDGPLAAGYLLLAARALGYGTVFITDVIPENVTKEVFQIPDNYTRVCITPLGVPVELPSTPTKKPLEEFIIYEKF